MTTFRIPEFKQFNSAEVVEKVKTLNFTPVYTINFPSNDGFVSSSRFILMVNPKNSMVAILLESISSVTYVSPEGVYIKEYTHIPQKGLDDLYVKLIRSGWVESLRGFERA